MGEGNTADGDEEVPGRTRHIRLPGRPPLSSSPIPLEERPEKKIRGRGREEERNSDKKTKKKASRFGDINTEEGGGGGGGFCDKMNDKEE